MKFLIDTEEVSLIGFPMYQIGTNKAFTFSIETEEGEYLAGAYLSLSDVSQVGKVFARISGSSTYIEVPDVTDNTLYLGEILENTTLELEVLFNFVSGDIDEFGEVFFNLCVIDGIPDPSLSGSLLFTGEDGPELFEGSTGSLWV